MEVALVKFHVGHKALVSARYNVALVRARPRLRLGVPETGHFGPGFTRFWLLPNNISHNKFQKGTSPGVMEDKSIFYLTKDVTLN